MEEKIKPIVARFTKQPEEQLTAQSLIDRSVVASSIILHRMYAQLAAAGFVISDYSSIKTYGELLKAIDPAKKAEQQEAIDETATAGSGIGIDIEAADALPVVKDYRSDAFYTGNFAPAEISYCLLQPDPPSSFAGLFAAKEAICKADNRYKKIPFHSIIIDHLPGGKPVFAGFNISIAHANHTAVAVAIKENPSPASLPALPPAANADAAFRLAFISLLISIVAVAALLLKSC